MNQKERTQTTQKTSKIWKLGQVVGAAIIVAAIWGVCSANSSTPEQSDPSAAIKTVGWMVAGLGGIVVFLGSRLLAWWFHG